MKVSGLLCLLGFVVAQNGPCLEPFAPPSCSTQVEERTRRECVPTTEKVCTMRSIYINTVVYEHICKDVVTYKCDPTPTKPPHTMPPCHKPPCNPNTHQQHQKRPALSSNQIYYGKRRKRQILPYFAPTQNTHTHAIQPNCHPVTTKQCSNIPRVEAVPKDIEECHTVTKEDCKVVPYKVDKTKCSLVTTCPPGYIAQSNSSDSDPEQPQHQCVEPDYKVECDLEHTTCDPQIEALYRGIKEIEKQNSERIARINIVGNSWKAGKTSLFSKSYSEVLAYWTGDIPPPMSQVLMIDPEKEGFLAHLESKRNTRSKRQIEDTEREEEVFSIDANNQEACAACSAFSVAAAMDTCWYKAMSENKEDALDYKSPPPHPHIHTTPVYITYPFYPVYYWTSNTTKAAPSDPSFPVAPPGGFSTQNILDCAFDKNIKGRNGCDGGQSHNYLKWLKSAGGSLDSTRQYPFVDANIKIEGPNSNYRQCYQSKDRPTTAVLQEVINSWDNHTERDLENILLDGHAIITTMYVSPNFQLYKSGVYQDSECQDWAFGSQRSSQWEETSGLRPLRHSVVIIGFGEESGLKYWKVKNSWGENWGSSGFLKIIRNGKAHCGLGAYFSVALCRKCPTGGCPSPSVISQGSPPDFREQPNLPDQGISRGFTTTLLTPTTGIHEVVGGQGLQQLQGCNRRRCVRPARNGQKKCCRMTQYGIRITCPSKC